MPLTALETGLLAVLAISAYTDVRTGLIYNAVTYPAIVAGLTATLLGAGPGPAATIAGCLAGGGTLYVMFAFGWMGGGDVKLMAAVGAVVGFPLVLSVLFYSIFFGGAAAAALLAWRGQLGAVASDVASLACECGVEHARVPARGGSLPFGVAIALGTLVAMLRVDSV